MKNFFKLFRKGEKGQVLVIVALTFTMLVAVVGLSIDMGYMYVSYARLRRAVDAAALAGSGEFKRNYTANRLQGAALQVLDMNLNGVDTNDANTFPVRLIETCDTVAAENSWDLTDPADVDLAVAKEEAEHPSQEVCTKPLKKIVRATIEQNIPTFFLTIVGIESYPIKVISLSEAATVDVVLSIDTSESMTWGWDINNQTSGDDRDPSQCNIYNSCTPFIDVKNAAAQFVDNLYLPYDRVGIVTFSKDAELILAMSDDRDDVLDAIDSLKVFEANQACPYNAQQQTYSGLTRDTFTAIPGDVVNPCRLYHTSVSGPGYVAGSYIGFDCPAFYGLTPDAAACSTTNTSDGVALGGSILTGDYSSAASYYPVPAGGWPAKRSSSLWVLLLLTDGAANSGHDSVGNRLCPAAVNSYDWWEAPNQHPLCRDANTKVRHCWDNTLNSAGVNDCMSASYPVGTSSSVDQSHYDGDDRARDMFDVVSRNNTLIFTIGMGSQTKLNAPRYDVNGDAPGIVLLQYGAFGTTYAMTPYSGALKGLYYYGNNASDLTRIFLKIANNLATRINQ